MLHFGRLGFRCRGLSRPADRTERDGAEVALQLYGGEAPPNSGGKQERHNRTGAREGSVCEEGITETWGTCLGGRGVMTS